MSNNRLYSTLGLWYGTGDSKDKNYWIVHNNTKIGKRVLKAHLDDYFLIDGNKYQIIDIFFIQKDAIFADVVDRALPENEQAVSSIQVCEPGTNWNRIIVGSLVK